MTEQLPGIFVNQNDLITKFQNSKIWPVMDYIDPPDEVQASDLAKAAKQARYARIMQAIETWEQLYQKKLSAGTITRALQLIGQAEGFIE